MLTVSCRVSIIGATGSGKSSFINDATGLKLPVSHDLDSCTKRIQATNMILEGRPLVLLDTPGFGHSDLSDTEVLRLIGEYLANLYRNGIKLTGLVYMQRISDPRFDSQAQRYFGIFQGICGHSNLDRTVVVTTRWNEIDARVGNAREKELASGVFQPVLAARGKVVRHDQSVDSATEILRHALKKDARVVRIQSQLIDHDVELLSTEAGLKLSKNVEVVRPRGFKRWLRRLWG
ncbi:hypothetical protein BD410DRAFT_729037 [Rickenella mellea]|uniref:G domain-containing protein n=1 Tax=Rickenella mellea TaxID=50990 RepID=A0A4Y7PRE0_9AGAM|nr:hypothetical protein BD410DRAFT_729037 [Rickenella mellea]